MIRDVLESPPRPVTGDAPPPQRPVRPPSTARFWRRRVLVIAIVATLVIGMAMAGSLAWSAKQYNDIDRVDLNTEQVAAGDPMNILIVGSDSRAVSLSGEDASSIAGGEETGGQRADTILVMRVFPEAHAAELLSIPRDLEVELSGRFQPVKINESYADGPQGVIDALKNDLGIPISHYIEVNFDSFKDLVDALGGVSLYFPYPSRDRHTGLNIPEPGCVVVDGETALRFARSRYFTYKDDQGVWHSDPTSDYGRISRQQIFIERALEKVAQLGVGDFNTVRHLIETGSEAVKIDSGLSLGVMWDLAQQFKDFSVSAMRVHRLPTYETRSKHVRLAEENSAAVLELFRGASEPSTSIPEPTTLQPDSVLVEVYNRSGLNGTAKTAQEKLEAAGFRVVSVGSKGKAEESVVRFAPGSRDIASYLASALSPEPALVEDGEAPAGRVVLELAEKGISVVGETESATASPVVTDATPDGQIGATFGRPPAGVSC